MAKSLLALESYLKFLYKKLSYSSLWECKGVGMNFFTDV